MAQRGPEGETLTCSICLDLLKEPVTIPCRHSYCKTCINRHWDRANNIYSCPQCTEIFTLRPFLLRNTKLARLLKDLKSRRDVTPSSATFFEKNIQPHHELIPLKSHKLVDPSKKLQKICSRHDEVRKTEKQKELQKSRANVQKNIEDKEKDVEQLKHQVKTMNDSADKDLETNMMYITGLIQLLQQRRTELEKKVRYKQQTEVSVLQALQEKLEQEIIELKKRDVELEKISTIDDHIQFFLRYNKLSALSVSTHSSIIIKPPGNCFKGVTAVVSELNQHLHKVLREHWTKVCHAVEDVEVLPTAMTRERLLKYSKEIILDPNTANRWLQLSEENRKVTRMYECQPYPDHPDRFTRLWQVLSRESLTGHCYWEVEWRKEIVELVVAYKSISRAGIGNECRFGFNEKSWSLICSTNYYLFHHNNISTSVSGPQSSRIGVYVDHTAGILSFYSVSEKMTLLHRVKTTFTEPLHAGVYIYQDGDSVQFGNPI